MPSREDFVEILYRALAEPVGLRVRTSDPTRIRDYFYAESTKVPAFKQLTLVRSARDGSEFLIIKREVYDAFRRARKENAEPEEGGLELPDGYLPTQGGIDI